MSYLIQSNQIPSYQIDETDELIITLDILPPASTPNYQEMYPRLTVDGNVIQIRYARWRESENGLSTECSFGLLDIADRSAIVPGVPIKFEIGTVAAGSPTITWFTIVDLAELSRKDFAIAGDSFTFSMKSGITDKLNLTPVENLVIYDPVRVPFDASEIEILRDTIGREYGVEDFPVNGLTLYELFDEVIINRIGFTAYETNIPDYPIRRADFEIGTPFINGIAPLIGVFEPVLFEDQASDTLWILDTTQELPPGYPDPRDLSSFGCSDATISSAFGNFDYAEMIYSVPDVFDYYSTRYEYDSRDNGGTLVAGTLITTTVERQIAEFRNFAVPDLILKEETKVNQADTYKGIVAGNPIHSERTENTFDSYGRLKTSVKTVKETLPDPSTASDLVYIESENETTEIRYAQHPRILARQYQKSLTRLTESLIIEDTENPYAYSSDSKFRQKLGIAHRAGNVIEGQAVILAPTSSYESRAKVLANGLIEDVITQADLVADTLHISVTEPKVGDISVNGSQSRGARMLVFDPPDATITTGKKLSVVVGDIPVDIAEELTRRKLRRSQRDGQQASVSLIGIDLTIRRGSVFTVSDKVFASEGAFLCTSFEGQFVATPDGNEFNMVLGGIGI